MRAFAPLRRTLASGGRLTYFQRIAWFRTFRAWKKTAFAECLPKNALPDTVAILLSYKRPQNIDVITRLLLQTPSIAKVIISNNNPDFRMCDWLSIQDPRLHVIEQPIHRQCDIRFGIAARETTYDKFLAVDDDLFLKPSQMEVLCSSLRADPSRPCGISGFLYDSWRGMKYHNIHHRTQYVDGLNRVYAFTSKHVEGFRQLIRDTAFFTTHSVCYCDDLFLSFSAGKPKVMYTGAYLDCPSQSERGVALWREPEFFSFRLKLLLLLRSLRPHQP